ncbi:MAG TPA: 50S ribosomal protein L29, partial [Pseudolabrys sp.]|nr:50S ribosomal protein L29 [Pseudolabrys sp.]
ENTSRVRQVRRDIARIKTIAGQKRAGQSPASASAATATKSPRKRSARPKAKSK